MEYMEQIQLFVDGGSRGNPGPAAGAYVIKDAEGTILLSEGFYLGQATNNVAEYTALLRGLEAVQKCDVRELAIFSDSELMVKQIIGEYRVRSDGLLELFEQVQRKLLNFDRWKIKHVRRDLNKDADQLVNKTLDREAKASSAGKKKTGMAEAQSATLPEPSAVISEKAEAGGEEVSLKVMVEVIAESNEDVCPSPMRKGQCFVFSNCVPAGLCVHAALALLPTVVALQHDPSSRGSSMMVKCGEPGCGASFKLTVL
jgi:uncharacterized repeat protein (TIGR04076 family)